MTVALGVLLFGATSVVGLVWTASAMSRRDLLTAGITLGGSVFAMGFCATALLTRFRRTPVRGSSDQHGTILRPDRLATGVTTVSFAAMIPAGILYVVFVPRGVVDIPLSRGEQLFTPVLIAFLTALAAGGVVAHVLRGPGHLRLSPEGFEIRELLSTKTGTWCDVIDITDSAPHAKARHPIIIAMGSGASHVIQGADGYVPEGATLYWMMRHYWLHPDSRTELTDGQALQRLRNHDFEPE